MRHITGMISDVQRFSIHDGPGIRTTVFMKGCPLRCWWCHNPETWQIKPEIQFFEDKCIGCGNCATECKKGAQVVLNGSRHFRRELCDGCGSCTTVCYTGALVLSGRRWKPEELLKELLKDKSYYEHSSGGITLSGGEPLLQKNFTREVLRLCKAASLHTAIETSGFCAWEDLAEILPTIDLVIMDIKHLDEEKHIKATGVSNRIVLENARRLAGSNVDLIIRTPVIPDINDQLSDIGCIAEFIHNFPNLLYYELMPFHNIAKGKYRSLGLQYSTQKLERPLHKTLEALRLHAEKMGVKETRISDICLV